MQQRTPLPLIVNLMGGICRHPDDTEEPTIGFIYIGRVQEIINLRQAANQHGIEIIQNRIRARPGLSLNTTHLQKTKHYNTITIISSNLENVSTEIGRCMIKLITSSNYLQSHPTMVL